MFGFKDLIGYYKDGFFYLEDINSIKVGSFATVESDTVSESDVDSKCSSILESLGFVGDRKRQQKTNISYIDDNIPSKKDSTQKGR